jgi:CHAD domain-containing protein
LPPLRLAQPWVINRRVRRLLIELRRLVLTENPATREVHAIRVHIKKLRSWLRLQKPVSGTCYPSLDYLLKNLACSYAEAREYHVMSETLARLESSCRDADMASNCREIMASLPQPANPVSGKLDKENVLGHLEEEFPQLLPGALPVLPQALVESAAKVEKSLHSKKVRKGRQAALHNLRKLMKRLDQQLMITGSDANHGITRRHALLAQVTETLGDLHDLVVLGLWLHTHRSSQAITPDLILLVQSTVERETQIALEKTVNVFHTRKIVFFD